MKKKTDKASWGETLHLHLRCIRDVWRIRPGHILSMICHDFFFSLNPYVTVFLSAQIIGELAGQRRPEVLWRWVIITTLVEAFVSIAKALLNRWEAAERAIFHNRRQKELYCKKMLSMDFADVDKQSTHDMLAQIEQTADSGGWGINRAVYYLDVLFSAVVGIAGVVILTVSLFTQQVPASAGSWAVLNHWGFVVGLLVILAITITLSARCEVRSVAEWAKANDSILFGNRCRSVYGHYCAQESRAADIRMYRQHKITERYLETNNAFGKDGILAKKEVGIIGIMSALSGSFSTIFTGFVYLYVCLKAWAGAFGVGSVSQYVGAFTTLSWHVSRFMEAIGNMRSNTPFLRTIYDFMDIPNAMYQGSLPTEKRGDREYDVEFKDVSFKYPGSEAYALRHVNMKFKIGRRLAVVGENGSGKTTFIKLLCRLYDPQEGQILLNGIDIRKYNYRDYMDVFAVVFQDFQLLSQPLGANVAGSQVFDRDRAEKALIDAGFEERLNTMPDGLDTLLYKEYAQNGVEVSGGEAQKIAIARALYKDAPFIILDEPTAALDPIAEAEIYGKFNEIVTDKTAIYISHRLSSCIFCDEIAVFHDGQVIQQGTHKELLQDATGKYYALWQAQAQYYKT